MGLQVTSAVSQEIWFRVSCNCFRSKKFGIVFSLLADLKASIVNQDIFVLTLNRNADQGCSWIWKYNHRHHHYGLFVHGSDNIIHEFSSSSNWYFPPVFLSPEEKQQITTTKLERCSSRQKLLQSNLNEKGRSIKERLIPVQSWTQNCCQGFLSGQPKSPRHQDSRHGAQERSVSSGQITNRT